MKRSVLFGLMFALVVAVAPFALAQSEQGIVVVPSSSEVQVNVQVQDAFGNAQTSFQPGQHVRVVINTNAQNVSQLYLNVVDIDASGHCTLIFPNAFSANTQVPVGQYVLPDKSSYQFTIVPPNGTEYVEAFASLDPLDLRQLFNSPTTPGNPFPTLCSNPQQFAQQVQGAIQGIVAQSRIATAYTSFTVGSQPTNRPPVASFSATTLQPRAGQQVRFDASSSSDSDGYISSYFWTFGDGASATGRVVSHAFQGSGQYTVTLRVTDNSGASSSSSKTVTVQQQANQPPVASFSLSPTSPRTGETVTFSSHSYDPDGVIVQHLWTFGDGATAAGSTAFHAYAAPGIYTVTLYVTDNQGAQTSTSQQLVVGANQFAQMGFYVDAVDNSHVRVSIQGDSNWLTSHNYDIQLETNGQFTTVDRQASGNVAGLGIVPTPTNQQQLDLTGAVRSGRVSYVVGFTSDTTEIKFKLRLDSNGDGQLEQRKDFVYVGSQMINPPSNPFAIKFASGHLTPLLQAQICLFLVDQPGFQFTVCFNFSSLQ